MFFNKKLILLGMVVLLASSAGMYAAAARIQSAGRCL